MATSASEQEKKYRRQQAEQTKKINQTYDSYAAAVEDSIRRQTENAAQQRDQSLTEQKQAYRDMHDQAAAQEYINRQKTREAMSNAGLSDSGLNRTQQTAISISRGNQDAQLTRQQQAAREATMLAYNELVAKFEAEKEAQRLANEQKRQAALTDLESVTGDNIAKAYAAEAEAAAKNQKLMQDAYLKLLDKTGDEAEADRLMQKLYGVSVGASGISGQGDAGETVTGGNTPFSQMTFKKVKDTRNGGLKMFGKDNNGFGDFLNHIGGGDAAKGEVKQGVLGNVDWDDEFYIDGSYFADGKGRHMTTEEIKEELLNEGLSEQEARRILLELTNLAESDTYNDKKAAEYQIDNYVRDLSSRIKAGKTTFAEGTEEIMGKYTSGEQQLAALMALGMTQAEAQSAQKAYKTYASLY